MDPNWKCVFIVIPKTNVLKLHTWDMDPKEILFLNNKCNDKPTWMFACKEYNVGNGSFNISESIDLNLFLVPHHNSIWTLSTHQTHLNLTLPSVQILYRQNRQSKTHILETNNTSAELLVPFEEDYLIEIRTVSDGGDGSSSEEIRIPKMSSELSCCFVWSGHLQHKCSQGLSGC